jgi:hypothetical protein
MFTGRRRSPGDLAQTNAQLSKIGLVLNSGHSAGTGPKNCVKTVRMIVTNYATIAR